MYPAPSLLDNELIVFPPVKGKKKTPASSTIYQYILIIPNNCLSTVS